MNFPQALKHLAIAAASANAATSPPACGVYPACNTQCSMAYPKFTFNAYPLAFCPISTVNQADAPKSISLYPGQCVSVTSGPGIVLKGARSFGGFTFSHGAATNSQPAECVIRAFQQDGCKGSATVTGNLFDATYSGYCYDSVTGAGPPSSIAQQAEEITALSFRADCFLSTPCAA